MFIFLYRITAQTASCLTNTKCRLVPLLHSPGDGFFSDAVTRRRCALMAVQMKCWDCNCHIRCLSSSSKKWAAGGGWWVERQGRAADLLCRVRDRVTDVAWRSSPSSHAVSMAGMTQQTIRQTYFGLNVILCCNMLSTGSSVSKSDSGWNPGFICRQGHEVSSTPPHHFFQTSSALLLLYLTTLSVLQAM